ncbi:VOC family protein [Jeotgalibacillus terrae]|uniref:VOC family protein n=1 Tax=Jeotgalibacillus terrae TaxID=587735 RepID=A0ABW5ZKN1_9BACL|nr:VOC family protein [Jeotgalibacillus terrae]MBM7578097.1 catechol 2,3-dioxygenase [Jeotgalibacillus terrae]
MGFHSKPTTFIRNVEIKVENLHRSIEFYQNKLGFSVLDQTASTAKLTADGRTSFLSLVQPEYAKPKQGRTTGLYHFAILLPKRSDLANIVIHFAENGIRVGASDHDVSEALYLNDPDGNGIEIYYDRDPAEWSWRNEEVAMTVDPLNFDELLTHATPEKPWQGMPEKTVMGHIHLHVSELKKTEEFYVKGLGMDLVNRFGGQALFLSYGNYHHHVGVNVWNGVGAPAPDPESVGLESYVLSFADEEVLNETIRNLKSIDATVDEEGEYVVTFDPSGNQIKLTV